MTNNNYWYAVMQDAEDQDWGTGSYNYDEAVAMVRPYLADGGYIAVIEESEHDSVCVDEIHDFEKQTVKFGGMEFATCTFIAEDGSQVSGLFVHDASDEFGNGDGVIADCDLPETAEDAENMLLNEYLNTDGNVLDTVKLI